MALEPQNQGNRLVQVYSNPSADSYLEIARIHYL